MSEPTRYERLQRWIKNDFTRSNTLQPQLDAGESKMLVNLDDHSDTYALTDRFEKFGPYNVVSVRNFSSYDVRVYLNASRDSFVTVPASTNQAIPALERVATRYVSYVRVENLNANNAISEGDLEIAIGNEVDSIELDLLEMSGMLDV